MKHLSLSSLCFASSLLFGLVSFGCDNGSPLSKLHAPIVSDSDKTPTKLETRWSRLSFGHYPLREIVGSTFTNVLDYAYAETDILKDPALLERLSKAEWKQEKLTLDGVTYQRMLEPETASTAQHYTYDDPGKKYHYFECQRIPWRVLSLEGSRATLMADLALDCLPYHPDESGATWNKSYLRSYLNSLDAAQNQSGISFAGGGFLYQAFSSEERNGLLKHRSEESVNEDYDTTTGTPCEDYVYLLDHDELFASEKAGKYGFYVGHGYDDPAKRFKSSMYAKFKGTWFSPVKGYRGNCFHFMRTPGYKQSYASYICDFGYIYSRGTSSDCFDAGILPVIDVDLNKFSWTLENERSSTDMMQPVSEDASSSGTFEQGKWETIDYGEYPQEEVSKDDETYGALRMATWTKDETILDDIRYRRVGDRYFEYQPISWRILEKEGDSALLFASFGLDCHAFHDSLTYVTWEDSDVREFLNTDFLDMAFKEGDEAIEERQIDNDANYYFGTECGNDTLDKAFLLCEHDVFGEDAAKRHGFAPSDATNDEGRRIVPTDYALAQGAWVSKNGEGFYSLRTSGYSNANAVYVGERGDIYNRGIPVTCSDMTLVPAMWVNLSLIP